MLALLLLLLDTSGTRPLPVEKLGSSWTQIEVRTEQGLEVKVFENHMLKRVETWTQLQDGTWFLRVRNDLFVSAVQAGGGWETRPTRRLVLRNGGWHHVRKPENRETQAPHSHHQ